MNNDAWWTFLVPYKDTKYQAIACPNQSGVSDNNWLAYPHTKETTRIKIRLWDSDSVNAVSGRPVEHITMGYIDLSTFTSLNSGT